MMFKKLISFAFVCAVFSVSSQADVGVFTGNGQNLRQVTSEKIQLVSIDVSIVPGRGLFQFDGSVPGMNRVEYHCNFVLKNLARKNATVQVGFPVDSMFTQRPYISDNENAKDWVLNYSFIARDEKNTYHVDFARKDIEDKFQSIFTWQMKFEAGETKNLTVQYALPMSMSLAETNTEDYPLFQVYQEPKRPFMKDLNVGIVEFFGYVTETGSSWAGKVEKATFRCINGPFEKYYDSRGILDYLSDDDEDDETQAVNFPSFSPWWFCVVEPADGKTECKDSVNVVTWEYRDYKPRDKITFHYYKTVLPRFAADVDKFVDSRFKPELYGKEGGDDKKIAKRICADLITMKEIMLATYGKKPTDRNAREYARTQIWYKPKRNFSMANLSDEQKAILAAFDRRIKNLEK